MGKHGKITQIYCKVTIAKVSVNGLSLLRRYSAPGDAIDMQFVALFSRKIDLLTIQISLTSVNYFLVKTYCENE